MNSKEQKVEPTFSGNSTKPLVIGRAKGNEFRCHV